MWAASTCLMLPPSWPGGHAGYAVHQPPQQHQCSALETSLNCAVSVVRCAMATARRIAWAGQRSCWHSTMASAARWRPGARLATQ
jgi:hypothetical protein